MGGLSPEEIELHYQSHMCALLDKWQTPQNVRPFKKEVDDIVAIRNMIIPLGKFAVHPGTGQKILGLWNLQTVNCSVVDFYTCKHFDGQNCQIYESRPHPCKDYGVTHACEYWGNGCTWKSVPYHQPKERAVKSDIPIKRVTAERESPPVDSLRNLIPKRKIEIPSLPRSEDGKKFRMLTEKETEQMMSEVSPVDLSYMWKPTIPVRFKAEQGDGGRFRMLTKKQFEEMKDQVTPLTSADVELLTFKDGVDLDGATPKEKKETIIKKSKSGILGIPRVGRIAKQVKKETSRWKERREFISNRADERKLKKFRKEISARKFVDAD
jgi:Fe-S-cluster containining protein